MTMREKMARGLCAEDGYAPDDDGGVQGVARWRSYLSIADAALAALEEPTEAMLRAVPFGDAEGIWRAMIGAAKGEG